MSKKSLKKIKKKLKWIEDSTDNIETNSGVIIFLLVGIFITLLVISSKL